MIPFVTPFGVFALLALLSRVGPLARRYSLADAAAWSLATLLIVTGFAHFSPLRADLIRMVPPLFPRPDLLVTVTGVFELLGAVGLFLRPTQKIAGVALAVLFLALLPANIYAAHEGLTLGGDPVPPLWLRIPEQLIYVGFALAPIASASRSRTPGADQPPPRPGPPGAAAGRGKRGAHAA